MSKGEALPFQSGLVPDLTSIKSKFTQHAFLTDSLGVPTCTCVLLKLVSPVHHLLVPLGAVLSIPASSFRLHLADVKCPPKPGDRQQPALPVLVGRGQQLGQVTTPRHKVCI